MKPLVIICLLVLGTYTAAEAECGPQPSCFMLEAAAAPPSPPLMVQLLAKPKVLVPVSQASQLPISQGFKASQLPISQGFKTSQIPISQGFKASKFPISQGFKASKFPMSQGFKASKFPMSQGPHTLISQNFPASHMTLSEVSKAARIPLTQSFQASEIPMSQHYEISQIPMSQVSQGSQFLISAASEVPVSEVFPKRQVPEPEVSIFSVPLGHQIAVSRLSAPELGQVQFAPVQQFAAPTALLKRSCGDVTASQYTNCYTRPWQSGTCTTITTSIPDLRLSNLDNEIQSVLQTGVWLYYENSHYNLVPGKVFYILGTNIEVTFPDSYRNTISSIRLVGDEENKHEEMLIAYEGAAFTKGQYSSPSDVPSFRPVIDKVSSLIITGRTPWTIFTDELYNGNNVCVYPKDEPNSTPGLQVFGVGMFTNVTSLGLPIASARKGCWSGIGAKPLVMHVDGQQNNGCWGRIV